MGQLLAVDIELSGEPATDWPLTVASVKIWGSRGQDYLSTSSLALKDHSKKQAKSLSPASSRTSAPAPEESFP
jgi:hypothetical protein